MAEREQRHRAGAQGRQQWEEQRRGQDGDRGGGNGGAAGERCSGCEQGLEPLLPEGEGRESAHYVARHPST